MSVEFAYAQARAQARHGQRLSPDTWSLLESSVGLAQYLHLVRGTALASCVEHFSPTTSPHVIERSLRHEWHSEVDSAKCWVPLRWRAAVAWTSRLAELPAVSHLLHDGAALPWMADDPVLSALVAEDADTVRAIIEELLPELTAAGYEGDDALAAWLRSWQRLWPDDTKRDPAFESLVMLIERHARDSNARGANHWRDELEHHALRVLRGHREQPVTVFCHLLLSALELHRLRQGLLQRAVFNDLDTEVAA